LSVAAVATVVYLSFSARGTRTETRNYASKLRALEADCARRPLQAVKRS